MGDEAWYLSKLLTHYYNESNSTLEFIRAYWMDRGDKPTLITIFQGILIPLGQGNVYWIWAAHSFLCIALALVGLISNYKNSAQLDLFLRASMILTFPPFFESLITYMSEGLFVAVSIGLFSIKNLLSRKYALWAALLVLCRPIVGSMTVLPHFLSLSALEKLLSIRRVVFMGACFLFFFGFTIVNYIYEMLFFPWLFGVSAVCMLYTKLYSVFIKADVSSKSFYAGQVLFWFLLSLFLSNHIHQIISWLWLPVEAHTVQTLGYRFILGTLKDFASLYFLGPYAYFTMGVFLFFIMSVCLTKSWKLLVTPFVMAALFLTTVVLFRLSEYRFLIYGYSAFIIHITMSINLQVFPSKLKIAARSLFVLILALNTWIIGTVLLQQKDGFTSNAFVSRAGRVLQRLKLYRSEDPALELNKTINTWIDKYNIKKIWLEEEHSCQISGLDCISESRRLEINYLHYFKSAPPYFSSKPEEPLAVHSTYKVLGPYVAHGKGTSIIHDSLVRIDLTHSQVIDLVKLYEPETENFSTYYLVKVSDQKIESIKEKSHILSTKYGLTNYKGYLDLHFLESNFKSSMDSFNHKIHKFKDFFFIALVSMGEEDGDLFGFSLCGEGRLLIHAPIYENEVHFFAGQSTLALPRGPKKEVLTLLAGGYSAEGKMVLFRNGLMSEDIALGLDLIDWSYPLIGRSSCGGVFKGDIKFIKFYEEAPNVKEIWGLWLAYLFSQNNF